MISIAAAIDLGRVIGKNGQLPWHLPSDLKRFRAITLGKAVVMGRKTFESIGHALPRRENIVVTSRPDYVAKGCRVAHSFAAALELAAQRSDETVVIGGARLFAEALPIAQRIYLTILDAHFEGDAHFPDLDLQHWSQVHHEFHEATAHEPFDHHFMVMDRWAV